MTTVHALPESGIGDDGAMSGDRGDPSGPKKRPRRLSRAQADWPPALGPLKDLLYEVYLAAGAPNLDEVAGGIAADSELPGSPGRDTVRRVISEPGMPPSLADVVSIATVLARLAAWPPEDLAGRVRDLWMAARMTQRVGRLISEYADDDRLVLEDLEVHPALDAGGAHGRFGVLPTYIRRDHDRRVDEVVAVAEGGRSGIAVLVGGSSTGKTRALWEAVRRLSGNWRLWHPTRPEAALAGLGEIAPHTVLWLNEAQNYLGPNGLAEQVAAALRSLLNDPSRAPLLVLATLWPEHWITLTNRTSPDLHPHARELLNGHAISVPDAFTAQDLAALTDIAGGDPRLALAARRADDAQITQYLAGVPVLLDRYEMARGATQALIHAAMDARRLGAGPHLPLAWLADAAPGYLTDSEYNTLSNDWLTRALDYVTTPCNGISGILTPVRTGGLAEGRNSRAKPARHSTSHITGPHYLLADYLDQHGRRYRAEALPPIDFWTAASNHAHPADLNTLGDAAWNRGLYRDSAQLHKHATARGNPRAAASLVGHFHRLHPTDSRPARWAASHISLDNPRPMVQLLAALHGTGWREQADAVAAHIAAHLPLDDSSSVVQLLGVLRGLGWREPMAVLEARAAEHVPLDDLNAIIELLRGMRGVGVDALLARDPAAHIPVDDPCSVAHMLELLEEKGAQGQVGVLATRAATHAPLDDPRSVVELLAALRMTGAQEQVGILLRREPAAHVHLNDVIAVAELMDALRRAGTQEQVCVLLARDLATHVSLDDPHAVAHLLDELRKAGAQEQAAVLAARAAAHAPLDNPRSVADLLDVLRSLEPQEPAGVLATRAAAHASLGNPRLAAGLLAALRRAGAQEQAGTLAARAAHASLDDPHSVAHLLDGLRALDAWEEAGVLAGRAATLAPLDDPRSVAHLLTALRRTGGQEQVDLLLARNPAAHVPLDDPRSVAHLLDALRKAQAPEQVDVLLARNPAAHASLDNVLSLAHLLSAFRKAGAQEQVGALAERLPAAGHFHETIDERNTEQFRFGREPDGRPASSWSWDDME
ncbi:hypothetical protein [Streptomyces sp. NPDC048002]|uniref:hypothetical protein n=1 Tax=Streptomyces sp. NPDC048002 TaxID=3154344 RepID=UPI0033CA81BC